MNSKWVNCGLAFLTLGIIAAEITGCKKDDDGNPTSLKIPILVKPDQDTLVNESSTLGGFFFKGIDPKTGAVGVAIGNGDFSAEASALNQVNGINFVGADDPVTVPVDQKGKFYFENIRQVADPASFRVANEFVDVDALPGKKFNAITTLNPSLTGYHKAWENPTELPNTLFVQNINSSAVRTSATHIHIRSSATTISEFLDMTDKFNRNNPTAIKYTSASIRAIVQDGHPVKSGTVPRNATVYPF